MQARRAINMLVMYAFYPGLAYHVVSHARFGPDFWWVPLYTELLASVMVATTLLYFAVLPLWLWLLL